MALEVGAVDYADSIDGKSSKKAEKSPSKHVPNSNDLRSYKAAVWERTVKAKPQDRDLVVNWLNSSIEQDDWSQAQKATAQLRTNFPNERNWEFLNILMLFMLHQDRSRPTHERMLHGRLAYNFMKKAAELVPEDPQNLLSPKKALQTPEELNFLVKLYILTGHAKDAVDLLMQQHRFGIESQFAKQDAALVRSLQLEVCHAAEAWDFLAEMCERRLRMVSVEKTFDDSRLWDILLDAVRKTKDSASLQRVQRQIDQSSSTNTSRNCTRIKLSLLSVAERTSSEILFEQTIEAYRTFRTEVFCFDDLHPILRTLPISQKAEFLQRAARFDHNGLSPKLQVQQDVNYLRCLWSLRDSTSTKKELVGFLKTTLEAYKFSSKVECSSPEILHILISALITGSSEDHGHMGKQLQSSLLFQACALLETSLSLYPEHYPFATLLLRATKFLGLPSLAVETFQKLSIKNLQWETAAYVLLERASTMHPKPYSGSQKSEEDFEVRDSLSHALRVLERTEDMIRHQITTGMNSGTYANVLEAFDLRTKLQYSLNKQILVQERNKIDRLRDRETSSKPGATPLSVDSLVDNRDFQYASSQEVLPIRHQATAEAPVPKHSWLQYTECLNSISRILRRDLHKPSDKPSTKAPDIDPAALTIIVDGLNALTASEDKSDMTAEERGILKMLLSVSSVMQWIQFSTNESRETLISSFRHHLSVIEDWLKLKGDSIENLSNLGLQLTDELYVPSWEYLHVSYTIFEMAELLHMLALWLKCKKTQKHASGWLIKEALGNFNIDSWTAEPVNRIRELKFQVSSFKKRLGEPGVLARLVDLCLGRVEGEFEAEDGTKRTSTMKEFGFDVEPVLSEIDAEVFCGKIKDSWEEALTSLENVLVTERTFFDIGIQLPHR